MPRHLKHSIVFLTIAALIIIPFASQSLAQESAQPNYGAEKMTADLILVRPLGIVATVFGTVVFVVALPFSLLGGNTGEAFQNLMAEPAKFTFTRPLGDI